MSRLFQLAKKKLRGVWLVVVAVAGSVVSQPKTSVWQARERGELILSPAVFARRRKRNLYRRRTLDEDVALPMLRVAHFGRAYAKRGQQYCECENHCYPILCKCYRAAPRDDPPIAEY